MGAADFFTEEFSREKLLATYQDHIAKTSAVGIDRLGKRQFEKQLDKHLEVLHSKVSSRTYRFSQYKEKLISKGAKKFPRIISIPTFRDRVALRAICNVLTKTFGSELSLKIPQAVISEIKKFIESGEYKFFAKLDIKEFYPSIRHDLLLRRLKRKIRKQSILDVIMSSIKTSTVPFPDKTAEENKTGVPQGLAVSNILAEIYLSPFDRKYLKREGIQYFRYVDDVLIFSKTDAVSLVAEIGDHLRIEHGLVAHALEGGGGKTVCGQMADTFYFLGYEFRGQKCLAKIESVRRLESSLADIFTTYKYKVDGVRAQALDEKSRQYKLRVAQNILMWRLNLRVTGCQFEGARKGWIFYFSQIDEAHLEQLWKLDRTVDNLLKRFGLPADARAKSFVRTYFETKRGNPTASSYIPNFDTTSIEQQRIILASYFGMAHLDDWPDAAIQLEFSRRIRRATKELELDIQDIS